MRLRSPEQLMPFATAGELTAHKHRPRYSVSPDTTARRTLLKTAAVTVAIGVFYLTGIY
jgi:hypothetical protein